MELAGGSAEDGEEDPDAKRRRILEESRDIDADSEEDDDDDDSEEDSDDDEDEEAELQRELEKIRRERAEKREREEREKAAAEEEEREKDIALGNPLLNPKNFNLKRRWDDDVVFKNQARGTEDKGKRKEFINVSSLDHPLRWSLMLTMRVGSSAIGFPQTVHEQVCQIRRTLCGNDSFARRYTPNMRLIMIFSHRARGRQTGFRLLESKCELALDAEGNIYLRIYPHSSPLASY